MKIARFAAGGRIHTGTVTADGRPVDAAGRDYDPGAVVWLPPVEPLKVVGLAINYADHAAELGKVDLPADLAQHTVAAPVLFMKPPTAMSGHGAPIVYPTGAQFMHYEGELAVVIGRAGRAVRAADALDYVKGYTAANDVTVRDYVNNFYRPPVKAKGFDSFGPLGPWLVTADEFGDPSDVTIRTFVNGDLKQEGNTRALIHTIPAIIAYITQFMTLEENDVILTGTPEGISAIHPGDTVRVVVDRIGALENPVVGET